MQQLDIDTLEMLGAALRREQDDHPLEPLPPPLRALIAQLGEREIEEAAQRDRQS